MLCDGRLEIRTRHAASFCRSYERLCAVKSRGVFPNETTTPIPARPTIERLAVDADLASVERDEDQAALPLRLRRDHVGLLASREERQDEELRMPEAGERCGMMIKFITAVAWIWGTLCRLTVLVQFIPPIKQEDIERGLRNFGLGLLAWAWLIARYIL